MSLTTQNSEVHSDGSSNSIDATENTEKIITDEFPENQKTKIRGTFFTLNNYTDDDIKRMISLVIGKEDSRYLVYQLEEGEVDHTPHVQGFFYFHNQIQLGTLNKALPTAHFMKPRCIKACIKYCKKDKTRIAGPFEYGLMPEQGRRTDLEEVARKFLTLSMKEFVEQCPTEYVRYHRGLQALKMASTTHRDRNTPPIVKWYWGNAGTLKTRTAFESHTTSYIKDGTTWWNGYEQQVAIIIDDFDGKWPYRDLLRLLDRYPYQGQVKGDYVKINSPYIYITCEHPPGMFWQGNELAQVNRRISEVRCFNPVMETEALPGSKEETHVQAHAAEAEDPDDILDVLNHMAQTK